MPKFGLSGLALMRGKKFFFGSSMKVQYLSLHLSPRYQIKIGICYFGVFECVGSIQFIVAPRHYRQFDPPCSSLLKVPDSLTFNYHVLWIFSGEYQCSIGNEKCTAKLTVEEPKVQFVEKLETTTSGEVGKDIRLKVKLSNAGAHVTWKKDGAEVKSDKIETKAEGDSHR